VEEEDKTMDCMHGYFVIGNSMSISNSYRFVSTSTVDMGMGCHSAIHREIHTHSLGFMGIWII